MYKPLASTMRPPTPEMKRKQLLKAQYDLTPEQYDAMLNDQWQTCAICFKRQSGKKRFGVDHDHHTGRVRGILCTHGNTG